MENKTEVIIMLELLISPGKYVSGVDEDPESCIGKGWKLDV